MFYSIFAISIGASLGAVLRWILSGIFNSVATPFPLGTLIANLLGGYLIGVALGVFASHENLPLECRLFIITGFLGGLTTFSSFSAEIITLIEQQKYFWAFGTITLHVLGSLTMTFLGLMTFQFIRTFGK